jgi:hypothetical protein
MFLEICWKHREAVRPDCDPCAGIVTTSALPSRPASLPTALHPQLESCIGYVFGSFIDRAKAPSQHPDHDPGNATISDIPVDVKEASTELFIDLTSKLKIGICWVESFLIPQLCRTDSVDVSVDASRDEINNSHGIRGADSEPGVDIHSYTDHICLYAIRLSYQIVRKPQQEYRNHSRSIQGLLLLGQTAEFTSP